LGKIGAWGEREREGTVANLLKPRRHIFQTSAGKQKVEIFNNFNRYFLIKISKFSIKSKYMMSG